MVRMNPPRKIALVLACAATMLGWPPAVLAQPGKPVTYLALVWIKPDGQAHLAEYEKRFGALMKHWNVAAKPNAVLMPQRLQSAQNGGFAYPLPSRVDVVTFPDAETLPKILGSPEWLAIKPLRDAALEDFVLFETTNVMDPAQRK